MSAGPDRRGEDGSRRLDLPDAEVHYCPGWLDPAAAEVAFAALIAEIDWQVHRIRLFGREVDTPRLCSWIGDPGAAYAYSGTRFEPRAWTPTLQRLRERLQGEGVGTFNSVLANRYRSGRDSMGWHSDDERELGPAPVIASISLGAPRRFRLRHRRDPALRAELELEPGSLLIMQGQTQRHYRHDLPRTARPVGERINLTFRWIVGDGASPP